LPKEYYESAAGSFMKIAIRADSSFLMGTGHVMRCLALADELSKRNCEVRFCCCDLPGNVISLLSASGYRVIVLQIANDDKVNDAHHMIQAFKAEDYFPDWLVVDHYEIGWEWEHSLRVWVGHIMAIDDLADRIHDCDLLLDQNRSIPETEIYGRLLPPNSRVLMGTKYALLRSEFRRWRHQSSVRHQLNRIFVSFGGSDPACATLTTLTALRDLQLPTIGIDVVIGRSNPNSAKIQEFCEQFCSVTLHRQTDKIAELMSKADLAIGAAGTTSWERCCVGLPCIIITIADNQISIAESIESQNAGWYLGPSNLVKSERIGQVVRRLSSNLEEISECSRQAFGLVDGSGVQRVADTMLLST
jgi:UDP-2,4-diacetamido-2,4,6-trideoxy-beta-L-altropyranose hydrolase